MNGIVLDTTNGTHARTESAEEYGGVCLKEKYREFAITAMVRKLGLVLSAEAEQRAVDILLRRPELTKRALSRRNTSLHQLVALQGIHTLESSLGCILPPSVTDRASPVFFTTGNAFTLADLALNGIAHPFEGTSVPLLELPSFCHPPRLAGLIRLLQRGRIVRVSRALPQTATAVQTCRSVFAPGRMPFSLEEWATLPIDVVACSFHEMKAFARAGRSEADDAVTTDTDYVAVCVAPLADLYEKGGATRTPDVRLNHRGRETRHAPRPHLGVPIADVAFALMLQRAGGDDDGDALVEMCAVARQCHARLAAVPHMDAENIVLPFVVVDGCVFRVYALFHIEATRLAVELVACYDAGDVSQRMALMAAVGNILDWQQWAYMRNGWRPRRRRHRRLRRPRRRRHRRLRRQRRTKQPKQRQRRNPRQYCRKHRRHRNARQTGPHQPQRNKRRGPLTCLLVHTV